MSKLLAQRVYSIFLALVFERNFMSNLIIEGIKAEVDNNFSNIIGYNFLKTISSNNQQNQKKRALEFIKFLEKNEQYFAAKLINNECFVSGLALTFSTLIKEYSQIKRLQIYNIFLGFAKVNNKQKEYFQLEKMYHTLNLCSLEDIKTLEKLKPKTYFQSEKYLPYSRIEERKENPEHIFDYLFVSLSSLGIIYIQEVFTDASSVILTPFGQKFKEYLFQDSKNKDLLLD